MTSSSAAAAEAVAPARSANPPGLVARAAIVVAAAAVATALTLAFRDDIVISVFVFFYGAVVVASLYAGAAGGVVAAAVGLLVVDHAAVRPGASFAIPDARGAVPFAAFIVVAGITIVFASRLRRARLAARADRARLEQHVAELEARRHDIESLATELEQANAELETAMEDATDARNAALAGEERLRLLDEASRVLASSLDYETTIAAAARLAVPSFADWCAVDLLDGDEIKQLALAHVDPDKVRRAQELDAKYPRAAGASEAVATVIRTGEPVFLPVVTDEMLVAGARDQEHLDALRELGVHSAIVVPMAARSQTLGALTLVSSRPERRFDEASLAVARDLGRRVAIAIDNARLYRAALVANEAKANFLATMSHELRTPLAAVIGYEELLAEGIVGPVNDVQRQQLERIKSSAMHLLSLIDEILLFARVEAGREEVRIEAVAAKTVVDEAIALVRATLKGRTDLVVAAAEPVDPSLLVYTDTAKLRQMLLNLLANAVKFTPAGSVTVRVRPHGDFVDFDVQDTGIGISQENQKRIFDPFWQVTQSTTRAAGGSGLGLSVTRRLAELLGGTVGVESELGAGSTFRITLPRALRLVKADGAQLEPQAAVKQ